MIKVDESKINYDELLKYSDYFFQVYNYVSFYRYQTRNIFVVRMTYNNIVDFVLNVIQDNYVLHKDLFAKRKCYVGFQIKSLDERLAKQKNKGKIKHMNIIKKIYEYEFFLINKFQMHDKLLNKIQPREIKKNIIKI